MTTMTTPKPPKGRRWVRETEILLRTDRYHDPFYELDKGTLTTRAGERCCFAHEYSRAIPRKTTRKQLK